MISITIVISNSNYYRRKHTTKCQTIDKRKVKTEVKRNSGYPLS